MRNLSERLGERSFHGNTVTQVQRIATAMDAAFPDAAIEFECAEAAILEPVHVKDRHVVAAAMAVQADAIVTFNLADFAVAHLKEHLQIEVIHPDDFVMDLVDLHEKRAVSAFRELRARKQNPPWAYAPDWPGSIPAASCRVSPTKPSTPCRPGDAMACAHDSLPLRQCESDDCRASGNQDGDIEDGRLHAY
jgi:hypothetical protein